MTLDPAACTCRFLYIFFPRLQKRGGEELTLPACLFACLPACCRGVRGQGREVTTLGLEKILKEEFQAIFASFAFHEYCSRQGAETQVILLAGVKLPRRDRSSEVIRSAQEIAGGNGGGVTSFDQLLRHGGHSVLLKQTYFLVGKTSCLCLPTRYVARRTFFDTNIGKQYLPNSLMIFSRRQYLYHTMNIKPFHFFFFFFACASFCCCRCPNLLPI